MRGLLIKDWKLLKNQKFYLMVVVMVCIAFIMMEQDLIFITGYVAAVLSVLVTNTISYDELDNGYRYLFTLPVSRRGYVLEKYVFGISVILLVSVLDVLIGVLALAFKPAVYGKIEWGVVLLTALLSGVLIQAVAIPVQLKFGVEKSKLAVSIIVAGVLISAFMIHQVIELTQIDLSAFLEWIARAGQGVITAMGCLAAAAIMAFSCIVSTEIMGRKQF